MEKEITYQMNLSDWPVSDNGSVKQVMTRELNLSRKEISRLKFDGEILLNGKRIKVNDHMRVGDTLTLRFPEVETGSIPLLSEKPDILYEDEDVVVVNKPAGIPCHPVHGHLNDSMGSILASYYSQKGEDFVIRPVGRLDKDVSGAILYAKNRLAASRLSKDRETGYLNKDYTAFVSGVFDIKQGMIDAPIAKAEGERRRVTKDPDGKPAVTIFRVVSEFHIRQQSISELEVEIETGRTHQIRAHMSAAGHPLLGDDLYGGSTAVISRPALHCSKIEFMTPFTREERIVLAPLPEDMEALLRAQLDPSVLPEEVMAEPEEPKEKTAEIKAVPEADTVPEEPAVKNEEAKKNRTSVSAGGNAGDRILAALKEKGYSLDGGTPAVEDKSSGSGLRKILMVLLALILIAALGFLIYWFTSHRSEAVRVSKAEQQELYDALTITFKDEASVEYGGDFHPGDYVISAGGDLAYEGTVDTMKLGEQTVLYTVSTGAKNGATVSREYEKVFTVKDMLSPVITIENSIIRVALGEAFDPENNIISVMDLADGDSEYKIDTSGFDSSKEGTYVIRVTAEDSAGNKTSKAFKVIVGSGSAAETASPEPTPTPTPSASPSPTPTAAADVTAPVVTLSAESAVLTVGDAFNPGSLIASVTDNTDGDLVYNDTLAPGSFTVVSDVNTAAAGNYTVTVTAVDKAGNRTERTVTVTVKEPEPTPTPTPTPAQTSTPTASAAVNVVPNSSDPKGQIYNFLTGTMGLNKAQACGVLANMHRESRFISTADNGLGYYGLCQWGGERKDNLFSWCESNGYDATTIDGQLHFLQYEMPLYYPNTTAQLRACANDEEGARRACWIFAIGYEVAGEYYAELSMDKAAEYFNQ